ncbi:MAG: exodeoxyribonuclease I [Halothiobacillaceae bacterium]
MSNILWYDYETFSADPATGRIAQFAAIRTDEKLEPMGETIELFCKPCLDCLPDPQACLITGITPQQAEARGLIEPEFAKQVQAVLAVPGTCIAGYNSIRFDDAFTRFLFYRNFLDPYAHEWRDGNTRWDVLDVARYTYALRPEGIVWPLREDGAPSFKLTDLTEANGLAHANAHDALSDVRATIDLARLIRQQQPKLFDFAYSLRGKNAVRAFLDKEHDKPVLHTSGMFPAIFGSTTAIAVLGVHPRMSNRLIVADLRQDPARLLETPVEVLLELLFTRGEDLPAGVERPGIKELHLNRAPLLAPLRVLDAAGAARLQLDLDACQLHFDFIAEHHEAFATLARGLYAAEPSLRVLDAEAALYDGFIADADRARIAKAQSLSPEKLAQLQTEVRDERLRELVFRYRARYFPSSLNAKEALRWQELRASRLLHEEGGAGMSAPQFFARIEALRADPLSTGREWVILDELEAWGRQILHHAGLQEPATL